jgi:molybdopterin molybdotransferase
MSRPEGLAEASSKPKLLSIDEALALVETHVTPLPAEEVALEQAYGRYIAQELHAAVDLPPFASSAMDGYALRAQDTPGSLTVVGESSAGAPYVGELGRGEAVAISTGAVVPAQADAVVPIEDVSGTREQIEVGSALAAASFVRNRGSDIERGEKILDAGTRLGSAQIGAAAAVGLATVLCRHRASSTG